MPDSTHIDPRHGAVAPKSSRSRMIDDQGARLVDDLHAAFGHHHARALHAKGIVLEGTFVAASDAPTLCKAALFDGATVPIVVRFSNFTGWPHIADNIREASPRGMAIRFARGGALDLDVVTHNFNGFPVATSAEFGEFMRALGASGPDAPKPTPLDAFLIAHPAAKAYLAAQMPPPVSFATAAYYGINAVTFVNAQGARAYVRYQFVPHAGEAYLDEAARKTKDADYLMQEVAARVAERPIGFDWLAQIAEPVDKVEDPSIAWPPSRTRIPLGTVTIDRMGANAPAADRALCFMPGTLPPGIEMVDPMLAVRNAAYPVSFHERQ